MNCLHAIRKLNDEIKIIKFKIKESEIDNDDHSK